MTQLPEGPQHIAVEGVRIRVHGGMFTPADGQRLGEQVRAGLIERLSAQAVTGERAIGAITIRLETGTSDSLDGLAHRIVNAVLDMM